MPLKDMRISEEEKKESSVESVMDRPDFPHGLKIHLDEESYKKMDFKSIPKIGEKFALLAVAEVVDIHQNKIADDRDRISVGFQITQLGLDAKEEKVKDASEVIYGDS